MSGDVVIPDRSNAQRLEALKLANDVRFYRARLKIDIRAGRRHVVDVLQDNDPMVASMKVWDLLLAQPKIGRGRSTAMLKRVEMSPSKTVAGMTDRQRFALVDILIERFGNES